MTVDNAGLTATEQWCEDTFNFGVRDTLLCVSTLLQSLPRAWVALLILTEISLLNCPSLKIMLPRYLKLLTVFISMPSIVMVGWGALLFGVAGREPLSFQASWLGETALRNPWTCAAWFAGHWTCVPWVHSHQQTVLPGWDQSESLTWLWVSEGWIQKHQRGSRYTFLPQDPVQCSWRHMWRTRWRGLVPGHSLASPHWTCQKD